MTGVRVTFVDDEPNGLATLVGGLIEANLAQHPSRGDLLRSAVVCLTATDAEVGVTITLEPGAVTIENGVNGRADLHVTTDSRSLLGLSATPLRAGVPDPFHREGRAAVRSVFAGRTQVKGLVRHPITLVRLNRLLSVV
jgi:hypothetical protein